jgi:hypothetical protein
VPIAIPRFPFSGKSGFLQRITDRLSASPAMPCKVSYLSMFYLIRFFRACQPMREEKPYLTRRKNFVFRMALLLQVAENGGIC